MTPCAEGLQTYRVFRQGVTGWKLVCAKDSERAAKRVKNATHATLVLPSSHWQEQRRLGNYPACSVKTSRKAARKSK